MLHLKKLITLFTAVAFMASAPVFAKEDTPENIEGTTKVGAEKLIELMQNTADLVVIDSRKASDRAKGYIEGSVALVDTDTNEASLAKVLKSKSTPVAFYCNGVKCGRSGNAAKVAMGLGYTTIYWFRGGWDEWTQKGLPVMK